MPTVLHYESIAQYYRGHMECWSHLGEKAAIISSYDELAALLREELDTTPSNETTLLLKRLNA